MTKLVMWTIYDHPRDFPHCYIAREIHVYGNYIEHTSNIIVAPALEYLRAHFMQLGMSKIMRHPTDDAVIVETWL